jgi:hypothetical protein
METALAEKNCTVYIDCLGPSSGIHGNVAGAFFIFGVCNDVEGMESYEDINLVVVIFSSDFLSVFSFFFPTNSGGMAPRETKMQR